MTVPVGAELDPVTLMVTVRLWLESMLDGVGVTVTVGERVEALTMVMVVAPVAPE